MVRIGTLRPRPIAKWSTRTHSDRVCCIFKGKVGPFIGGTSDTMACCIYLDDPAFPNCEFDIHDGLLEIIEPGKRFSSSKIMGSRSISDIERIDVISKENKSGIAIISTKVFAIIVGILALVVLGDFKFSTERFGNKTVFVVFYKDGSSVQCFTYWPGWRECLDAAISAAAGSPSVPIGEPASSPPSTT